MPLPAGRAKGTRKGRLGDPHAASTATGAGNRRGTAWRGGSFASQLPQQALSLPPPRLLAGAGRRERILGGGGVCEVMSLDLCRAPFGASDGAKHRGGVSRAHVYVQSQTKSASHAIRGGDWDVRAPGAARPRGAEKPGWYECSTERREHAL